MNNIDNLIENLNKEQKEAVISTEGPNLIVAGAGSGKTRVLTTRLIHIINQKKAWANQILCVTFTNKAAKEMQNRVMQYIKGSSNAIPWLGTFHSISVKFLRRHAEALGYVPRSYASALAKLTLSITIAASDRPTSIELPRNSKFTTSLNDISYTFRTREKYIATPSSAGVYIFKTSEGSSDVPVYEGIEKTKTFFVGETADSQIYVIPDLTIDTTTIRIQVFDTSVSPTFTSYTNINKATRITSTSTHYQIKEVPNGYYEIIFGDGTSTGLAPVAGNKIVIDYLSTVGPEANGSSVFSTDVQVEGVNLEVVTSAPAAGGSFREGIESIRQNAPLYFTSQRRMVTAEDYTSQVLTNYGSSFSLAYTQPIFLIFLI